MVLRWDSLLDNINNVEGCGGLEVPGSWHPGSWGAIRCRCLGEGETQGLREVFDVWGLGDMPRD